MSASTDPVPPAGGTTARGFTLFLTVALGIAVVGYAIGLGHRPQARQTFGPDADHAAAKDLSDIDAPPATSYAELRGSRLGPNAGFRSTVPVSTEPARTAPDRPITDADKEQALAERSALRAYNGAPPVIPHAVDSRSSDACLACHEHGIQIGDRVARPIPHEAYTQCMQCHVAATPRFGEAELSVGNAFDGVAAPFRGERAYTAAPPTIPHTTHMREDCLSCHGPMGRFGLRTTHPERRSCTQCHGPSAALDQVPVATSAPER